LQQSSHGAVEVAPVPGVAWLALDGWHKAFNNVVNFAHPFVTKLARKLQQEQHSTQRQRRQLELGKITGKKKKTYVRINEALHTMIVDYNNRDPIRYLKDIARVLNINVVSLEDFHIYK